MAKRPVFEVVDKKPYVIVKDIEFKYHPGMSATQKIKNMQSIHKEYLDNNPTKNILEISTKSLKEEGRLLSAFNLKAYVPSVGLCVPVENIYQASKVFEKGQFDDLMFVSPKEAKKDARLTDSGCVIGYCFENKLYPSAPSTAFYNYLYIKALTENPDLSEYLLSFDAFTDIEFNPNKSLNCQARAAAVFVGLVKSKTLGQAMESFESFVRHTY